MAGGVQMALETRARLESGIIGGGHRIAAARLDAQRSTAGYVSEAMGGLSYLDYIRTLVPRIDSDWDGVRVGPAPHGSVCSACTGLGRSVAAAS